ncbi:acyltransferase family protein [Pseudomonas chlororaphis]|uniref:acyltransferase family protein n=1 Tax=Pseudomonas chlororaphis TaxID=587753 RepID=UPI00352B8E7F
MSTAKGLAGITSLRGLAATLVLVIHSFLFLGYSHTYSKNFELTNIGVDLFFVLSGFIMAFAHWDDFGKGASSVSVFLRKRIIRIYPMYFLITVLTAAVLYVAPKLFYSMEYSNLLVIKSLLFIPSQIGTGTSLILAVAWTLAFEVVLYLIFSVCLLFKRNTGLGIAATTLMTWAACGSIIHSENYIVEFFLSTLPIEFMAGILICIYFKSNRYSPIKNTTTIISIIATASLATIALTAVYPMSERTLTDNNRVIYYGIPAAIIFFCFLSIGRSKSRWVASAINSVGDASYSTYLTHFLAIGALKFVAVRIGVIESANIYALVAFSCAYCTVCGIIAHKLIEAPATRIFRNTLLNKNVRRPAIGSI